MNLLGLAVSVYASYEAFTLSQSHLRQGAVCPEVFSVPLCIIVLVCYVLIVLSWILVLLKRKKRLLSFAIFIIGLTPAVLLAFIGSTGELFGFSNCPRTENGFPKCYFSFGLLILLASLRALSSYFEKKSP